MRHVLDQNLIKKPRILVVDDEEKNLFAINSLLKKMDINIDLVGSGKAAVAKVIRERYALILLDIQMPEMDGFDTAALIKSNEKSANTPIIFITAFYNQLESIHKGYDSGAIEYLSKPIDAKILMSKIKIYLDLYREKENSRVISINLKKSNEELSNFAQIASHDLREPLRGIRNNIHFFQEDFGSKFGSDEMVQLERAKFLAEKLDKLVSALSTFSQISVMQEARGEVEVNRLVKDIVDATLYAKNGQNIKINIQPNLPMIRGDNTKIGELFQNLISNGIKYNDKDEIIISVGFDPQAGENGLFFVKDNGIGIADRHQVDVFNIFKRLHPDNKYGEGTGAGLTIVKKIIDLHNGTISIESEEGQGTTFWFALKG